MSTIARFRSRSTDNLFYEVIQEDDRLRCTCPGYAYRGFCLHADAVARWRLFRQEIDPDLVLDPPVRWRKESRA